jgi:hypothetical protein
MPLSINAVSPMSAPFLELVLGFTHSFDHKVAHVLAAHHMASAKPTPYFAQKFESVQKQNLLSAGSSIKFLPQFSLIHYRLYNSVIL